MGRGLHHAESSRVAYRAATLADAKHVGSNLRVQDYIEAYLQSHGKEPVEAVQESWKRACMSLAACIDDRPIAVFGISAQGDRASPWMMATPEADRFPKELVAFGRQFVTVWLNRFDCLWNYVYAENHKTIRWLKHLGFTVGTPEPVGHLGAPFCLFHQYRTNPNVC